MTKTPIMPKINITLPRDIAEAVKNLPEGGLSNTVQALAASEMLSSSVRNDVNAAISGAPRTIEEKIALTFKTFIDFHRSKLEDDEDVSHLSEADAQFYHSLAIAFQFSIRELMRGAESFTHGTEAEIFRVKAGDSEFVIVKRRYDSFSGTLAIDRECQLQVAARNVAKKTDGVRVPKIFDRLRGEDGSEYIVMEYVKGKTLWNLMVESIVNPSRSSEESLAIGAENPIARFFESRSGFETTFDNDTEAENGMRAWYQEYGERLGLKHDLGIMNTDPITRKTTYPNLEPYLEADLKKLSMFDAETVAYVAKKLRKFLKELHDEGIYHRDLNVRNIMLTPEGDIYVIDFGKGIQSSPNDFGAYDTQEGMGNTDFSIIEQFRAYGPKVLSDIEKRVKDAVEIKNGISLERVAKAADEL
ncbi:MAG: Protein kinase protein [Patescibacteria group bacterium]|nr:Protein kinase protein [Patescibacteria group bacterium]